MFGRVRSNQVVIIYPCLFIHTPAGKKKNHSGVEKSIFPRYDVMCPEKKCPYDMIQQ